MGSLGVAARPSRPALPGCSLHRRLAAPAAGLVGGCAARARGKCESEGSGWGDWDLRLAPRDQTDPVARGGGGWLGRRLCGSRARGGGARGGGGGGGGVVASP